jgi:hypothetical protein
MTRLDLLKGEIWALFNGFRAVRDATGKAVIELKVPIGVYLGMAIIPPLLLMVGYVVNYANDPKKVIWYAVAFLSFWLVLATAFVRMLGARSRLTITFDHSNNSLAVDSRGIHVNIPLRDIVVAEFATARGENTTLFRLEFVLRSGERVSATKYYFDYFEAEDRDLVLSAINQEIKVRGGMLP